MQNLSEKQVYLLADIPSMLYDSNRLKKRKEVCNYDYQNGFPRK